MTEHRITHRLAHTRQGHTTIIFTDAPAWKAVADRVVDHAQELTHE